MCDCRKETETTEHFILRCPFFVTGRQQILNSLYESHLSSQNLQKTSNWHPENKKILNCSINDKRAFERPQQLINANFISITLLCYCS